MTAKLFSKQLQSANGNLFKMFRKVKQLGARVNAPATMLYWVLWDS
jgi:hypothetical protein